MGEYLGLGILQVTGTSRSGEGIHLPFPCEKGRGDFKMGSEGESGEEPEFLSSPQHIFLLFSALMSTKTCSNG